LVRAARVVFEREGFLDTRVVDIVAEANVAYGTFYTYFDSKEEIFAEVVAALTADFRDIAEAEPVTGLSPAAGIERANRAYLRAYKKNARMMAILERVATFSPELQAVRVEARRYWLARSTQAIRSWQQEGIVDASIDPYYAASALGSMVDRSAYVWLVLGEPYDEDLAIEQLNLLYCRALGLECTEA
jgi:AcrR family transcriptional regulator